jgi:hypothetical protein
MRSPKNQIIEDLYTRGNEFLVESNYANYLGYYHSQSGKNYVGAKYNPIAISLIPYTEDKINTAYDVYNMDQVYFKLNPNVLNIIKQDNFPIVRSSYSYNEGPKQRFFIQQKNKLNAPIIEVNAATYKNAKSNPLYSVTVIFWEGLSTTEEELIRIEKELPGILMFIENSPL